MNGLVMIKTGMTIESREVAKMIGKQHKELLRDIRKYLSDISTSAELRSSDFFIESFYKDKKGEERLCYLLTKRGCEFVANKMTGKKGNLFTASYITKFNQMEQAQPVEQYQIPQTYSDALRLAADQQDQLEKQKPIVEYTKIMLLNPGLETTTVIAKNYGMGAKKFNGLLHELGIQYRQSGTWYLYAKYQDKGYTHIEPFDYVDNDGQKNIKNTMKCKAGGNVSLKNRQLYMDMTCHMIEQLTPREFSQIFPIAKEFKNQRFGVRDYFETVEFIGKIGWDKKIPDAFEFMMNYWNMEVLNYVVKLMGIVNDSRQRQTGKSVMQEFIERNGVI